MKILNQDKQRIFDFVGDVWVTQTGVNEAVVVAEKAGCNPYLGRYKDIDRAGEVLKEIFQYYRSGKKSYIMPAE